MIARGQTHDERAQGVHRPARRRDRDQAGDHARRSAERRRLTVAEPLDGDPAQHAQASGDQGVQEDRRGRAVGGQRRAGVEPEPAEPQQACAEEDERQVVWAHGVLLEADARAEYQCQRQCRSAGDDFDHKPAGVIQHPEVEQPAARPPHPVRDHRVHRNGPQRDEDHPRREPRAVGDGAADECGGDDREGELESGEQEFGHRSAYGRRIDAEHAEVREVSDQPAAGVLGERDGVAHQQPGHRARRDRDETHHDHVEHAGGADHAAVEDGQPRGHQQDHCGGGEQPGGGRGIDLWHVSSFGEFRRAYVSCFGPVTEDSPSAGLDEVLVRARRRGAALTLVFRAGLGAAVRVFGGAGQPEQAQLADLHPRPQGDRQIRDVGQLEGDVAGEPRIDEPRGGVGQQPEAAE